SREHARVRLGSSRFVLVDCSTNGTYISRDDGRDPVRIHRESFPLSGRGVIGLGVDPAEVPDDRDALVRFVFTP
ncbi:MAG: FHA domain-containing protein, partial [Gemmatimonadetes bacterium]|nr:FHA domain-containing protein [Gemmatimonadota bacterium]